MSKFIKRHEELGQRLVSFAPELVTRAALGKSCDCLGKPNPGPPFSNPRIAPLF